MDSISPKLFGTMLLSLGLLMVLKPVPTADKIEKFYSNYPLSFFYPGSPQLKIRPSFIRVLGAVIIVLGIVCFFS